MTSSRPFLVQALHQWIVENDCTPYLLANTEIEGVKVPTQYIENNKIILDIAPKAVRNLSLSQTGVSFETRFGGVVCYIEVPMQAVLAMYAKENGLGMIFEDDDFESTTPPPKGKAKKGDGKKGSHLKVVK